MLVFADEEERPLGRIAEMLAPIEDRDAVVVFIERKKKLGFRQECHGFDDVLAHAPSGVPVVMLGWQSPLAYADDPRWHAALGYPNVLFKKLPDGLVEIIAGINEATKQERTPDPLAIALLGAKVFAQEMSILNHDLWSAERSPEKMVLWLERARKQLGNKTQEECIAIVKQPRKEEDTPGQFAGQVFHDVCVDVEGTLFTEDCIFRPSVLAFAELFAMNGRPITIWTGGDLSNAKELLRKADIPYKLAAKQLFRGATVGIVIDDMPAEAFYNEYGINYGEYRQV